MFPAKINPNYKGSMLESLKIYGACLVLSAVIIAGLGYWLGPVGYVMGALVYFSCGIYLNIRLLKNLVEWHSVYNTLNNVSSEKLAFILAWPLKYIVLFIQIAIVEYM